MQPNGQQQQESSHLQQTVEQQEQETEQTSTTIQAQLEQQLSAEQQKTDECLDRLRRTQADFINYRHRIGLEQAQVRSAAQSELLSQLLPILDDLGRALGATPPKLVKQPWVQGLFLVARRLTTQLDQFGVRQIGTPGEHFDPHYHDAITTEERTDVPEGTILHVALPGYALGERVMRPAQVSVAVPPSSTDDAPAQQADS